MSFSVMLLVLIGASLHATWNALVKGGKDKYLDTVGVLLGATLLTLLYLPFLPLPARACWPYLAASTLVHQAYFTLIAFSYRKGEMSLVYPVTRGTAPALTALCSEVALHERLSFAGWAGVLFVSSGVLFLAFDHRRSEGFHLTPILLALANAAVIALYTLSDGQGVRLSGNALSYTSWGFLLCAVLFVPVALLIRKQEAVQHLKTEWRKGIIGGGCSLAAYALALWAMTRAPIASVAALREISILFGILIAAFTLKEVVTRMRVVAALLILAGAIVIKIA